MGQKWNIRDNISSWDFCEILDYLLLNSRIKYCVNLELHVVIWRKKIIMANDEKRTKLAKRLYPNLATWEILLWTAGWIFGVGYSIYHVYLASKRKEIKVS